MEPLHQNQSITEQILDEFFEQLYQDSTVPLSLVEDLRQLANKGKLDKSAKIFQAISLSFGSGDEAD